MATQNRATLIANLLKVARKHFKPIAPSKDRTLFEHLLFACLVEDSPIESAEQTLEALKKDYFGWNEVRVSTLRELTDALKPLVNPADSAARLKQTLHSVFESVYEFDIEPLKKQNIGVAVKTLQKYSGTTPFAVAYVTQHALGGHAIPLNRGAMITLHTVGIISDSEFKQNIVPGLERAVPKNKGVEVASLLHQLGIEVGKNPYGQNARKLMLEIAPNCKDRLPKRPTVKPPEPVAPPTPPKPEPKQSAVKAKGKESAAKSAPSKAPEKKSTQKPAPKKPAATKKPAKPTKKPVKKITKKPVNRKLTKKKPR